METLLISFVCSVVTGAAVAVFMRGNSSNQMQEKERSYKQGYDVGYADGRQKTVKKYENMMLTQRVDDNEIFVNGMNTMASFLVLEGFVTKKQVDFAVKRREAIHLGTCPLPESQALH